MGSNNPVDPESDDMEAAKDSQVVKPSFHDISVTNSNELTTEVEKQASSSRTVRKELPRKLSLAVNANPDQQMQALGLVWKTKSIKTDHESNTVQINEATLQGWS